METGIYLITNNINNKVYVGSAVNFKKRWTKKYNNHLENAFKKYGKENFFFHILEEVELDKKLLEIRETWWIDWFDATNPELGYNILKIANSSLGYKHNNISLEKMCGRKLTEKQKEHLSKIKTENPSLYWLGKNRDENTKTKISRTRKKRFASGEIENFWKNKTLPLEICEKMSQNKKKYYETHESPMKGKNHTNETKEIIKEKAIERYKNGAKPHNKTSIELVEKIENILSNDRMSYKKVAELFSISIASVNRIVKNMKNNGSMSKTYNSINRKRK